MSDFPTNLSPAGQRRREQILSVALRQARQRRQRRAVLRGGVVTAAIVAAGLVSALVLRVVDVHSPAPVVVKDFPAAPKTDAPQSHLPRSRPEWVISRINTDRGLSARLAAPGNDIPVQKIGDDQLLTQLDEANQPAGLAYVGEKRELLFRAPGH